MNQKIKKIFDLDFLIIIPIFTLMIIGILFIYSSGIDSSGNSVSNEYIKQIIWVVIGVVILITISLIDYRKLKDISFWIYIGFALLLIYTRIFGKYVNGARSWIGIGDFGIQPSEFAKIGFILFLAKFLSQNEGIETERIRFFKSLFIFAIPTLLILTQPDLGTASVFIPIYLFMAFASGISMRYIGMVLLGGILTILFTVLPLWQEFIYRQPVSIIRIFTDINLILIVIIVLSVITLFSLIGNLFFKKKYFYWITYASGLLTFGFIASFAASKVLKPYQIMRLIVFLNPEVDPLDTGWNIIQSVTAIGSGAGFGKGFLQGTQSHYRFLPQQSTDFIFSILSEEWGFLGGILVFLLYALLIFRCVIALKNTRDSFGFYIISGVIAMFFFHFVVNVGMTMGIMPITGIPLLFLSYGGSSLWTALLAVGLVLSINSRRMEHL